MKQGSLGPKFMQRSALTGSQCFLFCSPAFWNQLSSHSEGGKLRNRADPSLSRLFFTHTNKDSAFPIEVPPPVLSPYPLLSLSPSHSSQPFLSHTSLSLFRGPTSLPQHFRLKRYILWAPHVGQFRDSRSKGRHTSVGGVPAQPHLPAGPDQRGGLSEQEQRAGLRGSACARGCNQTPEEAMGKAGLKIVHQSKLTLWSPPSCHQPSANQDSLCTCGPQAHCEDPDT